MIAPIHKFVRHHLVEDHLRLGWMMTAALCGTHHGDWSRHMIWPCKCEVRIPKTVPPLGKLAGGVNAPGNLCGND